VYILSRVKNLCFKKTSAGQKNIKRSVKKSCWGIKNSGKKLLKNIRWTFAGHFSHF